MEWYLAALKKYADISGRARRKEYWMFVLANFLIAFALGVADGILGTAEVLSTLYSLGVFIPSVAVGVRRMHDTDHSGWWLLLPVVNLIFLCLDSQPGANRFGPNPKSASLVGAV